MKIFVASSKKHVGKIQEDIFIRDSFISKGIFSEIATLEDVIKFSKPFDVVILKSIWGYHLDCKMFLEQISILREKKIVLVNDYGFIYWNINKFKYLNEIKNVNVTPTSLLQIKHARTALYIRNTILEASKDFNSDMLVIKPSVSASGYLTYVYNINKKNSVAVNSLLTKRHLDFIVQPYRPSIFEGEISIIIINGRLLYGVIRFPGVLSDKKDTIYLKLNDLPIFIKKSASALGDFFLKKFETLPKICRVDFLRNTTSYEILEVELIDPDLFFRYIPENIREKAISMLLK